MKMLKTMKGESYVIRAEGKKTIDEEEYPGYRTTETSNMRSRSMKFHEFQSVSIHPLIETPLFQLHSNSPFKDIHPRRKLHCFFSIPCAKRKTNNFKYVNWNGYHLKDKYTALVTWFLKANGYKRYQRVRGQHHSNCRHWTLVNHAISIEAPGGQCWPSEIDKCERNLARYYPRANLKYFSSDKLDGFCRARPTYNACIDKLMPYCLVKRKAELKGLRNAYEYQCEEVYDIVVDSEPCLRGDSAQSEAKRCALSYQMNVNSAESVSTKCSEVNGYLACLKDKVGAECGNNAGYMIRNFTILTLGPLFKDRDCKLGQGSNVNHSSVPIMNVFLVFPILFHSLAFPIL
ncbi:hypothetical protein CAPTEDRAFT_222708 [Capitella teleta]|uniref:T20D4.11-like domain-containing protein n=1 Tax=Capitella teleta TaxID=283909 RepID=R7TFX5_CAPTE|nr:hypothetical protein CAPTEDRAFT_222708 [Capitella teleta]|eukprot:ELT90441.1 hypothetical protein CAPTEDRAFT_222708 [Capitella teleta]